MVNSYLPKNHLFAFVPCLITDALSALSAALRFVGAIAKLRRVTVSSVMPVRLSAWNNSKVYRENPSYIETGQE